MKKTVTTLHAVIGYPLSHSRSPLLHNAVYARLGMSAVLLPFSHPDIKALVSAIRTLSIPLTAVTMPFKQSIIPLLDVVDAGAKRTNAVNTVINRDGKLYGYNTDVDGIGYALRDTKLKNRNILLVGAGGAAYAVASVVKKAGGNLLYLNRTFARAKELQKKFGGTVVARSELSAENIDVIINATPLGMYPDTSVTSVPKELLSKHQVVFDLVYNPVHTKLLRSARRSGAKTISGLTMFAVQGLRQIELLSGKKIVTPRLVGDITKSLLKTL